MIMLINKRQPEGGMQTKFVSDSTSSLAECLKDVHVVAKFEPFQLDAVRLATEYKKRSNKN